MTSCKLTGNFAIVKRQHTNGYYIQMPSFVKNSDSKTIKVTKHVTQTEAVKTVVKTDNDYLIASVNATPLIESKPQVKTITQSTINYVPKNNVKIIKSDLVKRKEPHRPNQHYHSWMFISSIISSGVADILILLCLFPLVASAEETLCICACLFAFIGFCLMLAGLYDTKPNVYFWTTIILIVLYILVSLKIYLAGFIDAGVFLLLFGGGMLMGILRFIPSYLKYQGKI
jgi:hypothetical protein